jgi:hypothetical protein
MAAGGVPDRQLEGEAMRYLSHCLASGVFVQLSLLVGISDVFAADPATPPSPAVIEAPAATGWTYRVTPYGWLTALKGTQTVRGRSVKVDASFIDIVEKSDTLVALMGNIEAAAARSRSTATWSGARSASNAAMSEAER